MKRILVLFLILTVTVFSLTGCLIRTYEPIPQYAFEEYIEIEDDYEALEKYIRDGNLDFAKVGNVVVTYSWGIIKHGFNLVFRAYTLSEIDSLELKEAVLVLGNQSLPFEYKVNGPDKATETMNSYGFILTPTNRITGLLCEPYNEVIINLTVSVTEDETIVEKVLSFKMTLDKDWGMLTV